MRVLVVNPGSSTLKAALVVDGSATESETVDAADAAGEVGGLLRRWGPVDAIGVRVVHGGSRTDPVVVDDDVLAELDATVALAPLHNPPALAAARALREAADGVPVVACFDTAFHQTMPPAAYTYALPREWNRRWGLRRYGFHGLSHQYAAGRAAALVGRPLEELRTVVCHLGGGASLCAVVGGRSVDTTMGFTPLAGLVMQVRSGSVDPGLVLWLQQQAGIGLDEVSEGLERHGGLAGLTGTSGDMREVMAACDAGDRDARLGVDVYVHRLVREIGAMVASAGGLDVLVFTGGVGEHRSSIRQAVAQSLGWLGVALDESDDSGSDQPGSDQSGSDQPGSDQSGDRDISAPDARVRTLVIEAREDLQIAAAAEQLVGGR